MKPARCAWCTAGIQADEPRVLVGELVTCGEPCAKKVREHQARANPPRPAWDKRLSVEEVRARLVEKFGDAITFPPKRGRRFA